MADISSGNGWQGGGGYRLSLAPEAAGGLALREEARREELNGALVFFLSFIRTQLADVNNADTQKPTTTPTLGACQRASTCPYVHDPTKISVCSKYLRGTCPHADTTCPVSHKPDPHNAPSCVHFQRTGQCRNGKECRYPHVKVKDDAPVCLDFSTIGWCARGAACGERHAWECREYSETGACKKGKKCELMHILRAKPSAPKEAGPSEGRGGADDGGALPDDLVEVLRGERSAGVRPSEDDDDGDDDSEVETASDEEEEVDTADEEDDVDVIAGQQDFIHFNRPDEVDMD